MLDADEQLDVPTVVDVPARIEMKGTAAVVLAVPGRSIEPAPKVGLPTPAVDATEIVDTVTLPATAIEGEGTEDVVAATGATTVEPV